MFLAGTQCLLSIIRINSLPGTKLLRDDVIEYHVHMLPLIHVLTKNSVQYDYVAIMWGSSFFLCKLPGRKQYRCADETISLHL